MTNEKWKMMNGKSAFIPLKMGVPKPIRLTGLHILF